jgi:hypothetical protein
MLNKLMLSCLTSSQVETKLNVWAAEKTLSKKRQRKKSLAHFFFVSNGERANERKNDQEWKSFF